MAHAGASEVFLAAEPDDYAVDSVVGEEDQASSTSIASSILKYREENGRTYHAYKDGKYALPNDEAENDRLDLQHHLFSLTFDGKLHLSPIDKSKLHRILDAGTGTGIWAIDIADLYPQAEVVGIDLSPIQPAFVPPNVTFQIDDLEEPWTFNYKFDLIYARTMSGSLSDWPKFFQQCFENLNPGGYLEIVDVEMPLKTDDDTFPKDSELLKWSKLVVEVSSNSGRPLMNSATKYISQMEEAGFSKVFQNTFTWPMNRWPKDKHYKEIGWWNYENIAGGLSGLSMALFTRGLGWTQDEVELFLVDVRKEMKNTKIHSYWPVHVYYAQKPE
ncbi:hypothetical protein BP5796_13019 [Coleophoma crateriformis]|uniref:Uncharacterized protein n=1 Tax=Coleophoma crateriformis TaxID=565419 RepID=A0A3D8Q569_9HELO|nr:hypothetical protein BP5796_13019 [Coleophoma crateriformis]